MAKFSVFISYQWAIKSQVEIMHAKLIGKGLRVWRDDTQFRNISTEWTQQIAEGMSASTTVLICLTQKYLQSENCLKEIHYANSLKKPIVVLMIERLSMEACGGVGFIISSLLRVNCYNDANNWHVTFIEEIRRAIDQSSGVADQDEAYKEIMYILDKVIQSSTQFLNGLFKFSFFLEVENFPSSRFKLHRQ